MVGVGAGGKILKSEGVRHEREKMKTWLSLYENTLSYTERIPFE